jgi:hypothetical protein
MTVVVKKALEDEIKRISHLPQDEMAGAIGKIFGTVIATVGTGGAL